MHSVSRLCGRVCRWRRLRRCRRSKRRRSTCPGIDKPVMVVTGEITGTETWTNIYYVLRGAVFVRRARR